jgi:hypothetical protein
MLSLRLSRALAQGRAIRPEPTSRAALLASLLRKRAAAHNVGADDLEALLRDQIRWALPMERGPMGQEPIEREPVSAE